MAGPVADRAYRANSQAGNQHAAAEIPPEPPLPAQAPLQLSNAVALKYVGHPSLAIAYANDLRRDEHDRACHHQTVAMKNPDSVTFGRHRLAGARPGHECGENGD
jgi:hypothetical protein